MTQETINLTRPRGKGKKIGSGSEFLPGKENLTEIKDEGRSQKDEVKSSRGSGLLLPSSFCLLPWNWHPGGDEGGHHWVEIVAVA